MTYMAIHCTRTPAPGVIKFTILIGPSMVIIITHLVCLNSVIELRRRFLLKECIKNASRTHTPLVMKFTILVDPSLNWPSLLYT